jgi:hypothetical protein
MANKAQQDGECTRHKKEEEKTTLTNETILCFRGSGSMFTPPTNTTLISDMVRLITG